jgi:hypothetical protein
VGAYALGLLEAEERHAYERHLITCAHCLRTLEGLAPLIELLGQVDAATLLADADQGRVRRVAAHPPGALGALFPRQRDRRSRKALRVVPRSRGDSAPSRERVPRPRRRPWDEIDDRFRTSGAGPEPKPAGPPARPRKARSQGKGANTAVVRRLVLVAAALTVVTMLSLVTIVARSSVTGPASTVAAPPPRAPGPAAAAETTAAPPPTSAPPATAPAPPPRASTRPTTAPPPARTKETTKPAPAATRPDSIKADPGGDAEGDRLAGRDPATGAAAEVLLSRTAAGLDVSLTVTKLAGPCDCVLRMITTEGAAQTALRWRMAPGQESFTGLGSATVDRAAIDRFEVIDATGAVLVTISSS